MKRIGIIAAIAVLATSPVVAQNIDCSVIKNNPASRKRCEAGQADARKWQREAERQKAREERIKDRVREAARIADKCTDSPKACAKEAIRHNRAE